MTREPSLGIESFEGEWEKEWFTYQPDEWGRRTHKVNDPLWAAPEDAQLSLQVRSEEANTLVVGIDDYAVEVQLDGGERWQTVRLVISDFRNARGDALPSFSGIMELRLLRHDTLRARQPDATRRVGGPWEGDDPEFQNLKWIARSSD